MKNISTAFAAALTNAPVNGLSVARSIWITVKDRETGEPSSYGLWTWDDTITTNVIDAQTGSEVERTYYGGVNLVVPSIPLVSDLTAQSFQIEASQIAPIVLEIVRGKDARLAPVEVHQWVMSGNALVAVPEVIFYGIVDEIGLKTPAVGGEGQAGFSIVSEAMLMLTRTNPRKRSYEGQKQRQGDEFGLYSNAAAYSDVYWGEKKR